MSEKLKPCPFCGGEPKSNAWSAWCWGEGSEEHGLVKLVFAEWNRRHQEQDEPSTFERCMSK